MIRRTDIISENMLDDFKVIAEFDCGDWCCTDCPLYQCTSASGCASLEVKKLIRAYETGEEIIY